MGLEDGAESVDRPWLLTVLASFNDQHAFFDKNYRPSKAEKTTVERVEFYVDDPHGFLSNMVEPDRKGKKRGRNIFMSKQQRMELKIQRALVRGKKQEAAFERLLAEQEKEFPGTTQNIS